MSSEFEGWWADGQTAARQRVCVIGVSGAALELRSVDSARPVARLSVDGLALAEDVFPNQPVRLTHRDWPDALLTLDTPALLERLGPEGSHLRRRVRSSRHVGRGILIWGGAAVGSVAGLVAAVPWLASLIAPAMPQTWTAALGDEVVAQIESGRPVCENEAAQAALNRLAEHLLQAQTVNPKLTVRVLDSDAFNAVAIPGGHIRLFDGLVDGVDSPQALAAVLAHELAHVIERHPTESAIRQVGWRLVVVLVTGDVSGLPQIAGALSTGLLEQAHSREAEAEADRLAVSMLNGAGFDSRGMIDVFESLRQHQTSSIPVWLSSHPDLDDRIASVRPMVREGEAPMSDADWQAVQSMCN